MALISIGGVALPAPTSYKVTKSDLDSADSGRSETGVMQRNRVRSGVAKIEAAWSKLNAADTAKILNAVEPESFSVTYFFGTNHNATMYAGDRNADLISLNGDGSSYWDVSVNLIEY